jgi:hypothetical protein
MTPFDRDLILRNQIAIMRTLLLQAEAPARWTTDEDLKRRLKTQITETERYIVAERDRMLRP